MDNNPANFGLDDAQGANHGKRSSPNRRTVLRTVATGAVLGSGIVSGTGAVAASEGSSADDDDFETEPLSHKERGELRGDLFSSSAFKTIRQTIQDDGYYPQLEDVTAKRVINTDENYEREVMKIPCEYQGDEPDGRTRGAVLFAHRDNEEVFVRCISQCEGEPVLVRENADPVDDRGPANPDSDVFTLEIPGASAGGAH